jgi:hypothetical protein
MNIGAQSGLVDPKHEQVMGSAVWLYLWCVWRQTRRTGLVLGGMPFTYEELSKRSGFAQRKLRRWMETLKVGGYLEVTHTSYKLMRLRVLKSKKFNFKQAGLPFETSPENGQSDSPKNGHYVRPKTGDIETKNGQSNKSVSMSSNETPEAEEQTAAATAAFTAIGSDLGPYGQEAFQEVWVRKFRHHNGEWLTAVMEETIQECQRSKIGVPPRFYSAKHRIEEEENAQFADRYRKAPL